MSERARDPETGTFVTKLTDEVAKTITDALRAGAPPEMACSYAGVWRSTYYSWLERGREAIAAANGDLPAIVAADPFARLVIQADSALSQFAVGNMTTIGLHGRTDRDGDWRALAWQLERRFPAMFGRKTRHEVTGADGAPLRVEHAIVLDPSKLDALPMERKLLLAEILAELDGEVIDHDDSALALEPGGE